MLMTGNLKNATVAVDALSIWYTNLFENPKKLSFFTEFCVKFVQHEHQWMGDDDSFSILRRRWV